jgi:hypothetical protein
VPAWTVIEVGYSTRKKPPKLTYLIPDKSQFKRKQSGDVPDHIEYYDDEKGIAIIYDANENEITNIIIRPSLTNKQKFDCDLVKK